MSLYLATFVALATKLVSLPVSVSRNLCNPWNHTCLCICLCTLQPLQPSQNNLSVYLSLFLATFATLDTIPVCLSFSVPCNPCNLCNHTCLSVSVPPNLCNFSNHTCLFICLSNTRPLQPLQPYLSAYMSLYLATFAILATMPVFLPVSVLCNLCNPCNNTCLFI